MTEKKRSWLEIRHGANAASSVVAGRLKASGNSVSESGFVEAESAASLPGRANHADALVFETVGLRGRHLVVIQIAETGGSFEVILGLLGGGAGIPGHPRIAEGSAPNPALNP